MKSSSVSAGVWRTRIRARRDTNRPAVLTATGKQRRQPCGGRSPHSLPAGTWRPLRGTVWRFLTVRRCPHSSQRPAPQVHPRDVKASVHTPVCAHSSVVPGNQRVEATPESASRWTLKRNVLSADGGTRLSLRGEPGAARLAPGNVIPRERRRTHTAAWPGIPFTQNARDEQVSGLESRSAASRGSGETKEPSCHHNKKS